MKQIKSVLKEAKAIIYKFQKDIARYYNKHYILQLKNLRVGQ